MANKKKLETHLELTWVKVRGADGHKHVEARWIVVPTVGDHRVHAA